ncbi:hypothetical protein FO519_005325 [Halicephalobus sp. NKZ332]|nr:hypothetical protein FO519_005325 [Halicephalobus sp. NKZ332]
MSTEMAPASRQSNNFRPTGLKGISGKSPDQVNRRNARERKRVEQINNGYRDLAHRLSLWPPLKNKKISKVETLKCAVQYIRHLQELLQYGESSIDFEELDLDHGSPDSLPISLSPVDQNTSSSSSTVSLDPSSYFYTHEVKMEQSGGSPNYGSSRGYDSGYPSPNYSTQSHQAGPLAPIQLRSNYYYGQQWKGSPVYPNPSNQPYYSM